MSTIPNPSALEAAISKALGSLGELTEIEIAEIRAYQTSLAESLVADTKLVINQRREEIEADATRFKKRFEHLAERDSPPVWLEKAMADLNSRTKSYVDVMEIELQTYADELKSSHSNQ